MIRRHCALLSTVAFVSILALGCSIVQEVRGRPRPDFETIESAKGLTKRIGFVLKSLPQESKAHALGEQFATLYLQTLRDEDEQLQVVAARDGNAPDFIARLASDAPSRIDAAVLASNSRLSGFHGVIVAQVSGLRVFDYKSGILWFRKTRYSVALNVTLDVYDPYTAAKMMGAVEELQARISPEAYDGFQQGDVESIEALSELVNDAAEDLAERSAEAIERLPWQCTIVAIRGDRLVLPVGIESGLRQDQRLAVFKGQRIVKGYGNSDYIIPGKRIGHVRITAITQLQAEAQAENAIAANVGDILVPLR